MDNYRSALATIQDLSAADPTNADARRLLATGYQKVGGAQEELGDLKDALKSYANASAAKEELMRADPSDALASMSFVVSLRYIGDLLYKMGDRAGALTKYQRAVEILDQLAAAEPDNVQVQGRDSVMHIFVGQTLAEMGRPQEARVTTSRGLVITKELAKRDDATSEELSNYALTFLTCETAELRDLPTALKYAKESVAKPGGMDSEILDVLAQVYFESGNVAQAVETEEKASSLLPPKNVGEPTSSPRRRIETNLAKYRAAQKRQPSQSSNP